MNATGRRKQHEHGQVCVEHIRREYSVRNQRIRQHNTHRAGPHRCHAGVAGLVGIGIIAALDSVQKRLRTSYPLFLV